MNAMLNGTVDNKNIGLFDNLWRLRQALDVHCLISVNWNAIRKQGVGRDFFFFLELLCVHSIVLHTCKVFEEERHAEQGEVEYELNSIDGVLRAIDKERAAVLDSARIRDFVRKYGSDSGKDGLAALRSVIAKFRNEHSKALRSFRTLRNKWVAHSEFRFSAEGAPSYDVMERLFDFGLDFYMLVSRAFISVGPCNLNADRRVKASLMRVFEALGIEEIATEME